MEDNESFGEFFKREMGITVEEAAVQRPADLQIARRFYNKGWGNGFTKGYAEGRGERDSI